MAILGFCTLSINHSLFFWSPYTPQVLQTFLLQTFPLASHFSGGERSNIEAVPQQWPDQFRAKPHDYHYHP